MDPRHPQHPFSRSAAPPYSHAPFPATSSQPPYPSSSHPTSAPPYADTQRRTSENNYYPQTSAYPRDSAQIPTSGHSRHTSASSINHGPPINRSMLPPSSPQQQHQQPPHAQHPHSLSYPHPPLSRGPPPSLTSPSNFQTGRDLPSLSTTHRPVSLNSSMSISSMLGGSPTETREAAPPASQYPAASSMMVSAPPQATYAAPMHASPRSSAGGPDYGRFRRPRTPEHRLHEPQGVRDRANSAGSPTGPPSLSTPDAHRYSTPQAYPQRSVQQHHQTSSLDDRRDQYPLRVPNPNSAFPPRPSSQPASFGGPAPRLNEPARRVLDAGRPEPVYGRPVGYTDRDDLHTFLEERRLEEEAMRRRERERERERERDRERLELIERERIERLHLAATGSRPGEAAPYGRQYDPQPSGPYNDPREREVWIMRARQDQLAHEQPPAHSQAPVSVSYEYPRTQAQPYTPTAYASHESRHPHNSYGQGNHSPARPQNHSQFDNPSEDRPRVAGPDPPPPLYQIPMQVGRPYQLHESARSRANDELQQLQQRQYLGIQHEINRKGRSSPFPQAVQGAQVQMSGPGGEPGIKSEFGKMFSGIGSGVGSMASATGAVSSVSGVQTPFSGSGQLRREDSDGLVTQESIADISSHKLFRTASRGGRRRKLKEEDGKDDDNSSTGRHTPSGRGPKRPKVGQHQTGVANRHLNQLQEGGDQLSSPSNPSPNLFNNIGVAQAAQPSPTAESKVLVPHHHHINRHHHHHHHVGPHHRSTPVPAASTPVSIPKPKQIVRSNAVLDSVAHLPRHHLGHGTYQTHLETNDSRSVEHSLNPRRGFASTPEPLPRFEGQENCTFTIRIPRVHLASMSREEITSRRAVWGTDIYTDDSDVIAACIHSGWVRGEWHKDVDVSLLGLVIDPEDEKSEGESNKSTEKADASATKGKKKRFSKNRDIVLAKPPPNGPMSPPLEYDLHVTVLILPTLEKYSSTTRWGIMSREWNSTHDGLSFMIMSLRWVQGMSVSNIKEVGGKARKARMKTALENVDDEVAWSSLAENRSDHVVGSENGGVQESFVRGEGRSGKGPSREMRGLGMGSWWQDPEVKIKVEERTDHVTVAG